MKQAGHFLIENFFLLCYISFILGRRGVADGKKEGSSHEKKGHG